MTISDKIKEKLQDKIISWQDCSARRIYASIKPQDIKEVAHLLFKDLSLRFITASAQEMPEGGFQIIYHFTFDKTGEVISIKVDLPDKAKPEIDSITNIIIGAEWIEREIWELLGINFKNHPNLKRLLLAEEWPDGDYPLRHDHEHTGE